VLIGTSLGLLYVLDGETGFVRRNFPMQFHIIEAQIVVSDISNGPELEIIVADMAGNLVVLDVNGKILWDVQLPGSLPFAPSIGDIDGDGDLDVIIVAIHYLEKAKREVCYVFAIDGQSGIINKGYPIKLPQGARVTAPITLVDDLHDYSNINSKFAPSSDKNVPPWTYNTGGHIPTSAPILSPSLGTNSVTNDIKPKGLHMLISSFDGHVYIIADTGELENKERDLCAQRLDVGEHIYSSALVDDITGDGYLDILIGTLNGQVFVFSTTVPVHPLNTWTTIPRNRLNGFTMGGVGISVPELERNTLQYGVDTAGGNIGGVFVNFDIFDNRYSEDPRVYTVTITSGTNKLEPLVKAEYKQPGRYSLLVPMSAPASVSLVISMTTGYGLYYEDIIWVSISRRFYIWIKYLPTIPLIVLCLPLLLMRRQKRITNQLYD